MNYYTISINIIMIILLIKTNCIAEQEMSRAINTTGLWSKYNLIIKPTVPTNKGLITTTPESRYSPMDLPVDKDNEDSEEDEEEDDDEDEEDYLDTLTTTTQRSNGKPPTVDPKKPKGNDRKVKKKTRGHKTKKGLKKLKKYMLPLLLAYKLKFFTLIPLMLGGLVLIVATTGFAGFFFALFAVGVGLKKD